MLTPKYKFSTNTSWFYFINNYISCNIYYFADFVNNDNSFRIVKLH